MTEEMEVPESLKKLIEGPNFEAGFVIGVPLPYIRGSSGGFIFGPLLQEQETAPDCVVDEKGTQ